MTALAGRVFWVSLSTSVVLLPLLLLAGPICRRYRAKSCYVLWLLLALRLLIPVEVPLPQAPVTVEVPVVEFAVLETPQTGVEFPVQTQTNPTVVQPSPVRRDISPVEILGLIWAAGVVLLLAAQWINYSTLKQKLWNNSLGNPADQQQLAQLGAAVPVLRGDVESPLTFGLLHPAIFLPRVRYWAFRIRTFIGMAQMLVADYGGVVPSDGALLERLPGVGRKTANVVAMGYIAKLLPMIPYEIIAAEVEKSFAKKPKLIPINLDALRKGYEYAG